jgi:hypothetical protein
MLAGQIVESDVGAGERAHAFSVSSSGSPGLPRRA